MSGDRSVPDDHTWRVAICDLAGDLRPSRCHVAAGCGMCNEAEHHCACEFFDVVPSSWRVRAVAAEDDVIAAQVALRESGAEKDKLRAEVKRLTGQVARLHYAIKPASRVELEAAEERAATLAEALRANSAVAGDALEAVQAFIAGNGPRGASLLPLIQRANDAADLRDAALDSTTQKTEETNDG